ncbi:cysteine proteinase [Suillus lakei]|nr:cysteine proteinase [Suillus lakei]
MAPLQVHVKHAGKTLDVDLDTSLPPAVFKDAVYQVTGVPPERMKVMIKGGVLKDDTDWKKGQTFMVIGAAGELPKPPEKPIVFLEDMDESAIAEALSLPVGLKNLGNTCYMNATVQAMRAIPELQTALSTSPHLDVLPRALRDLYGNMSRTTEGYIPNTAVPQFGEVDRSGKNGILGGYAQQDAEECWTQLANGLKEVPGIDATGATIAGGRRFVDQFMMAEMRRELKCDEAPEEPSTVTIEKVLKIECNISATTNYMHTGIKDALNSRLEKNSPSLARQAVYSQTSRLSRLPSYLTVHMVRFAWRRDIGKKAKIMRKVKFASEFDALEVVTDELKSKLTPVSSRLKSIEKERAERRKVRKRTRVVQEASSSSRPAEENTDVEMAPASEVPGDLEEESVYRKRELLELEGLVDDDVKNDFGCSVTGLYDLVAIVTHKGADADAGHYIGFVKKSVFHAKSGDGPAFDEDDEDWYKFDDDKVSVFPKEKLGTIDGGGEDASAYVLLYRSKPLA